MALALLVPALFLVLFARVPAHAQTIQVYERSCFQVSGAEGTEYFVKYNFNVTAPTGISSWDTRATVGGTSWQLFAAEYFPGADGKLPTAAPVLFTHGIPSAATASRIELDAGGGGTAVATAPLSCVAFGVNRDESKCQKQLAKASRKLAVGRARCVSACEAYAAVGSVPASNCVPPYAGSTRQCVIAERSSAASKVGAGCAIDCPECYAGGNCGSHIDAVLDAAEASVDGWVDDVLCDDSASPNGLTSSERFCRQSVLYALTKLVTAQSRCVTKNARKIGGADTFACTLVAAGKANYLIKRVCTDPPECLALDSVGPAVQASVNNLDPLLYCSQ